MPKEAKTKAPKEPKAAKAPKEKKEKKEKTGPKRALSAYMYFASAKRSEVKASNPELTFTEIGKELGRLWGELSDKDKKPFQAQADADKARYQKEVAASA